MEITLSKMQISDLDLIAPILYSEFDNFWSYTVFKQELENSNSEYIVAKINDEIVGFAGFMKIIDEADITNIVVKKNFRNLKIGSKLLKNLMELAFRLNINKLNLEVNEENLPAIQLYKKLGFEICGLRKNYYNNRQNAILMRYTFKE